MPAVHFQPRALAPPLCGSTQPNQQSTLYPREVTCVGCIRIVRGKAAPHRSAPAGAAAASEEGS